MPESNQSPSVLVTGAGSGLGRAIGEHLDRAGYRVTGTVRSAARAAELTGAAQAAGRPLRFRSLDLTVAADIGALAAEIEQAGGIDILIHNAGAGVYGPVELVDGDAVAQQFETNLFGPLELTRRLLPGLRARRGRVIWVGSMAGRISLPFQAHYSATKSAIASISDAMRMELRPHGVEVTCVEPGDFATGFTDARSRIDAAASVYADAHARCLREVDKQERGAASPDLVGVAIVRLCRARSLPARVPVGPGSAFMCFLLRVLPDRLREYIVRKHYAQ
jgi:NAD(P)-dependent dehydrogenase (short-subunit alcohol dehydrogenase family)